MNANKFIGSFLVLLSLFMLVLKVSNSTLFSGLNAVDYFYLVFPIVLIIIGFYLMGRGYDVGFVPVLFGFLLLGIKVSNSTLFSALSAKDYLCLGLPTLFMVVGAYLKGRGDKK